MDLEKYDFSSSFFIERAYHEAYDMLRTARFKISCCDDQFMKAATKANALDEQECKTLAQRLHHAAGVMTKAKELIEDELLRFTGLLPLNSEPVSDSLRIGSLADCVRDGIQDNYSSYETWKCVARDILKNNAPEVYKDYLEEEMRLHAAKNKSASKKK